MPFCLESSTVREARDELGGAWRHLDGECRHKRSSEWLKFPRVSEYWAPSRSSRPLLGLGVERIQHGGCSRPEPISQVLNGVEAGVSRTQPLDGSLGMRTGRIGTAHIAAAEIVPVLCEPRPQLADDSPLRHVEHAKHLELCLWHCPDGADGVPQAGMQDKEAQKLGDTSQDL